MTDKKQSKESIELEDQIKSLTEQIYLLGAKLSHIELKSQLHKIFYSID